MRLHVLKKGLILKNTLNAVQRACELVELLGAGEVLGGVIDVTASKYVPLTLSLEAEKNQPTARHSDTCRVHGFDACKAGLYN